MHGEPFEARGGRTECNRCMIVICNAQVWCSLSPTTVATIQVSEQGFNRFIGKLAGHSE